MNQLIGVKRGISNCDGLPIEPRKQITGKQNNNGYLLCLPPEIILKILGSFSASGLKKIALTCKKLGEFSFDAHLLGNKVAVQALQEYFHRIFQNLDLEKTLWRRLSPTEIDNGLLRSTVDIKDFIEEICTKKKINKLILYFNKGELSRRDEVIVRDIDKLIQINCLKILKLFRCKIKSTVISSIGNLRSLRNFWVQFSDIDETEVQDFKGLTGLHTLVLERCGLDDLITEQIKGLTKLQRLSLEGNAITHLGISQLTALTNLRVISLNQNNVGDEGAKMLGARANLYGLLLNSNDISNAGLEYFRGLTNLEVLDLGYNNISNIGLGNLSHLTKLSELDLGNSLGDDQDRVITSVGLGYLTNLTNLKTLGLDFCENGNGVLETIRNLTQIRELYLDSVNICDLGVGYLVSKFVHLRQLSLKETLISDVGVGKLTALTNLESINLDSCENVTHECRDSMYQLISFRLMRIS